MHSCTRAFATAGVQSGKLSDSSVLAAWRRQVGIFKPDCESVGDCDCDIVAAVLDDCVTVTMITMATLFHYFTPPLLCFFANPNRDTKINIA